MARMTQVIRHPSQLSELSVLPGRRFPGRGQIVIGDEHVPQPVREEWERRLNRLYFACGCERAALGLGLATLGDLVWAGFHAHQWRDFGWRGVAIGMAVAFAGGLAGKTWGLIRAEQALRRATQEIRATWKQPKPTQPAEALGCG